MNIKNYRELTDEDRREIINKYYEFRQLNFKELASKLNVSERSIGRVLKENDINTKRKNRYTINEKFFSDIDTEEKAYILGYIYADGFVGNEKYNNIAITSIDLEILQKIARAMEFTGTIREGNQGSFKNSKIANVLNFSSLNMANDLRDLGLYPNKSLNIKNIPDIKKSLMRHFIRGYFDGDGSIIYTHGTSYHIVNGKKKKYIYNKMSFEILGTKCFLQEIIREMRLKHYQILDTRTEEIKRLVCRAKSDSKDIYEYLYGNSKIYMERKYTKWNYVLSAFTE